MKTYTIIVLMFLFSSTLQAPWWGLQSALACFTKFQFPKISLSVDDQFADECIDKWVRKAIEREDIQELNHLLSLKKSDGKKCNVNNIFVADRNAIHFAAWKNNYQMCELLLKAGANPNTPRKENLNRTPIWTAVQHKNFSLAQLFINYGADINHKDENDAHISAFCIINQSLICAQNLLALKKKDGSRALDIHQTTQGCGLLTIAAQGSVNSVDKAKLFLEAGADVNQRNKNAGKILTPIWNAVGHNSLEMTRLLIEHGADVNLQNDNDLSLLIHAYNNIENNDLSIFEEILACKPTNINHTYSNGKALLSCCATNQRVHGQVGLRMIKTMLAAGADLGTIRVGSNLPNQYDLIMASPDKNPAAIEFIQGAYLLKQGEYGKLHSSLYGQIILHSLEQRNKHPDQLLAMIKDDRNSPESEQMIPAPIKQIIKSKFKKDALDKWVVDFKEKQPDKKLH